MTDTSTPTPGGERRRGGPTRGIIVGRILPAVVRAATESDVTVADELTRHPAVVHAFEEAQQFLDEAERGVEAARRRGIQRLATAYELAVRDLANGRHKRLGLKTERRRQQWPA